MNGFKSFANVVTAAIIATAFFIAPQKINATPSFGDDMPPAAVDVFPSEMRSMWDIPKVTIWGWSRNGRVAYSTEIRCSATGATNIHFVIKNMVNDENLFETRLCGIGPDIKADEIVEGCDNGIRFQDRRELYDKLVELISSPLAAHGIEIQQDQDWLFYQRTQFNQFPFTWNNANYTARIREAGRESEWQVLYDVIVARNGREKTIGTVSTFDFGHEYRVLGFFRSPFENRILVVSGAPVASHGVVFHFKGCHLTAGFNQ